MLLHAKLSPKDDLIHKSASAVDIPFDNPNGIRTLLANGASTLNYFHTSFYFIGYQKYS